MKPLGEKLQNAFNARRFTGGLRQKDNRSPCLGNRFCKAYNGIPRGAKMEPRIEGADFQSVGFEHACYSNSEKFAMRAPTIGKPKREGIIVRNDPYPDLRSLINSSSSSVRIPSFFALSSLEPASRPTMTKSVLVLTLEETCPPRSS